jgi:Spy/CpxP family protein refolding chaperone
MDFKKITIFLVLIMTFSAVLFAQANGPMGQMPMRGGQGRGMGQMQNGARGQTGQNQPGVMNRNGGAQFYLNLRDTLKLTDDQAAKLQQMRVDYTKQTGDIESYLRVARLQLQDMMSAQTPKLSDIEKQIRSVYELEGSLQIEQVRAQTQAENVLTADQRAQIETTRQRRTQPSPAPAPNNPGTTNPGTPAPRRQGGN